MVVLPYLHDMDVLHPDNYAIFEVEAFSLAALFPVLSQHSENKKR